MAIPAKTARSKLLALCCVLVGGSCVHERSRGDQAEYEHVLRLPSQEQRLVLGRLSMDRQIDVYLYGMKSFHPPMMWVADEVARSGQPLAAKLAERLNSPANEAEYADLFYLAKVLVCKDITARQDSTLQYAIRRAATRVNHGRALVNGRGAVNGLEGRC
jgi:hypothetical protein